MLFPSRQDLVGKSANGEGVPKKCHHIGGKTANLRRRSITDCNTLGRPFGARKQSAATQAHADYSTTLNSKAEVERKELNAILDSGWASLASHEVFVSDASDTDDPQHGFHDGFSSAAFTTAYTSGAAPKGSPRQQQWLQPHGGSRNGDCGEKPLSVRHRNPAGPAATLSSCVVATARRRLKQGSPRALVVKMAAAAAAAPPLTPSPSSLPAQGPKAAATKAADTSSSNSVPYESGSGPRTKDRRRNSSPWDMQRTTAVVVMLLLVVAVVAAAGLLSPLRNGLGAARGPIPGPRVGGGGVGGAAWGDATGWGAASPLPCMAGWARLIGGMVRPTITTTAAAATAIAAGHVPQRASVIAAAVSPPHDRGRSTNGGGGIRGGGIGMRHLLRRWWYGSVAAGTAAAPRGGGGRGGGGSSSTSGSEEASDAITAAGTGHGAGQPPQLQPPSAPPQPQDYGWREVASVRVITVVNGGAPSPYRTSWESLAEHTALRFEWTDPSYQMMVFRAQQLGTDAGMQQAFLRALEGGAQVVVGLDITDPAAAAFLQDPRVSSKLPGVVLFVAGSEALSRGLTQLQGGLRPQDPGSWRTALARRLPWTPDGRGLMVWDTVQLLLGRHDSDNFLFVYLVLINQYVTTVRQVADTTKGFDLQSIICMVKNCGSKVVSCVQDVTCKSALDCLQACTFNDQVCQYRCIVSYESPLLEQFSLCILQLHNCRNLDAKPPLLPDPAPMASFRSAPLTHGTAEELFFGWLDEPGQGAPASSLLGERKGKPYSWLVAAGKNPAYDYFPCQHQLYYRGRGRGQVWYEPVFKAITVDGREVWRRRVYRVRRGKVPGTFHLSVLDNGVTSNEFWRILDCHEDLQFCLFYYSGAASAAGLSYSGAILATPDGRMPGAEHTDRLHSVLRRAGIEPWELSYVNNNDCRGPPLGITGPVAAPGHVAA